MLDSVLEGLDGLNNFVEFLLGAFGDFHNGNGGCGSAFGKADALGQELLTWHVAERNAFLLTDERDVCLLYTSPSPRD